MAISITIQNYLEDLGINYSPLAHDHTATSSMTAETSHDILPGIDTVIALGFAKARTFFVGRGMAIDAAFLQDRLNVLGKIRGCDGGAGNAKGKKNGRYY